MVLFQERWLVLVAISQQDGSTVKDIAPTTMQQFLIRAWPTSNLVAPDLKNRQHSCDGSNLDVDCLDNTLARKPEAQN